MKMICSIEDCEHDRPHEEKSNCFNIPDYLPTCKTCKTCVPVDLDNYGKKLSVWLHSDPAYSQILNFGSSGNL